MTARPSGVVLKYVEPGRRDVERAGLQRRDALGDERRAAVDEPRRLGAVRARAARNVVVVGLVGLAEVRRVRVRNRALRAHPVQRRARVEAAGERDADLLADGKVLQDVRHEGAPSGGEKSVILALVSRAGAAAVLKRRRMRGRARQASKRPLEDRCRSCPTSPSTSRRFPRAFADNRSSACASSIRSCCAPPCRRSATPTAGACVDVRRLGKRIVVALDGDLLPRLPPDDRRPVALARRARPSRRRGSRSRPSSSPSGTLAFTEAGTKRRASLHLVARRGGARALRSGRPRGRGRRPRERSPRASRARTTRSSAR